MLVSRLTALGLALSLLLPACSSTYANSERQVLPSFKSVSLAKKRLFIAPYSVKALDTERAVPLEPEQLEGLAKSFSDSDSNRVALKAFYSTGAEGAKGTLQKLGLDLNVLDLPTQRWQDYFQDSERFLSVSVDGKLRYQVPDAKLLNELGVEADFAIVLGSLAYSTTTTITSNGQVRHRSDSADFEGRFLVWDYRGAQVLAILVGSVALLMLGLQPLLLGALLEAGQVTLEGVGLVAMGEIVALGLGVLIGDLCLPVRSLRAITTLAALAAACSMPTSSYLPFGK